MLFPVVFDLPFSVIRGLKIGSLEDFGSSFLSGSDVDGVAGTGDTARDAAGAGEAARDGADNGDIVLDAIDALLSIGSTDAGRLSSSIGENARGGVLVAF